MSALAYETSNGLPQDVRSQVADLLTQHLANAIDLAAQTKQAHWNVKGPDFIALHKLFDEVHESVDAYVDLLAERVVQLGGIAQGSVRVAAECSQLDDYPHTIAEGPEHVNAIAGALADFGTRIRLAIDEAEDLGDRDTADICTEISRGIDKWLWFVEAHVQTASSVVP